MRAEGAGYIIAVQVLGVDVPGDCGFEMPPVYVIIRRNAYAVQESSYAVDFQFA